MHFRPATSRSGPRSNRWGGGRRRPNRDDALDLELGPILGVAAPAAKELELIAHQMLMKVLDFVMSGRHEFIGSLVVLIASLDLLSREYEVRVH